MPVCSHSHTHTHTHTHSHAQHSHAHTHTHTHSHAQHSHAHTHTHTHLHTCSVIRMKAVATIERWWLAVRNRRVFKILKEAICASVSCMFSTHIPWSSYFYGTVLLFCLSCKLKYPTRWFSIQEISMGCLVAMWLKHWMADLQVAGSNSTRQQGFFT